MNERDAERTKNSSQSCLQISDIHWCTGNWWSWMHWILLLFFFFWSLLELVHCSAQLRMWQTGAMPASTHMTYHQFAYPKMIPRCVKMKHSCRENDVILDNFSVSLDVSSQISPKMCSKVSKVFKNAAMLAGNCVYFFQRSFQQLSVFHPVHTAISGGSKPGSRTCEPLIRGEAMVRSASLRKRWHFLQWAHAQDPWFSVFHLCLTRFMTTRSEVHFGREEEKSWNVLQFGK